MASIINPQDLIKVTGTQLDTPTIQAIIDEADREIAAYLAPSGISASGDAAKAACLKFAQAGVAQYLRPDVDVSAYRRAGYAILDQLLETRDVQPRQRTGYMAIGGH
jgi:hypothetical protein